MARTSVPSSHTGMCATRSNNRRAPAAIAQPRTNTLPGSMTIDGELSVETVEIACSVLKNRNLPKKAVNPRPDRPHGGFIGQRMSFHWSHKAIANAWFGQDVLWVGGVGLDLLSQIGDATPQGLKAIHAVGPPYGAKQLAMRNSSPRL